MSAKFLTRNETLADSNVYLSTDSVCQLPETAGTVFRIAVFKGSTLQGYLVRLSGSVAALKNPFGYTASLLDSDRFILDSTSPSPTSCALTDTTFGVDRAVRTDNNDDSFGYYVYGKPDSQIPRTAEGLTVYPASCSVGDTQELSCSFHGETPSAFYTDVCFIYLVLCGVTDAPPRVLTSSTAMVAESAGPAAVISRKSSSERYQSRSIAFPWQKGTCA